MKWACKISDPWNKCNNVTDERFGMRVLDDVSSHQQTKLLAKYLQLCCFESRERKSKGRCMCFQTAYQKYPLVADTAQIAIQACNLI